MSFVHWIAIIALAWLLRRPARALGLPAVIGEMLAGFLLGPTLLGAIDPHTFSVIFPQTTIQQISRLASPIVTAYCLVIGLEFDGGHLKGRRAGLVLTAFSSAVVPAATGYLAASLLPDAISAMPFFPTCVAVCFSVTAFPVLLRMVEEAGLTADPAGVFAVGVAAILELLVWASLPVILAVTNAGSPAGAAKAIGWVACFLLAWFSVVTRGLRWLWAKLGVDGVPSLLLLAAVGVASALITDRLGMHANFGAFIGGMIVPRSVSFGLARKIKPACLFLLPVFFAAAGLKTTLNIGGADTLLILGCLMAVGYAVKALSTMLVARFSGGLDWSSAATVGHLTCAKGAIGFAVMEICLANGLLDLRGYSILALIILANTIMAGWGVLLQSRQRVTASLPSLA